MPVRIRGADPLGLFEPLLGLQGLRQAEERTHVLWVPVEVGAKHGFGFIGSKRTIYTICRQPIPPNVINPLGFVVDFGTIIL
jgi:hypothetical protein